MLLSTPALHAATPALTSAHRNLAILRTPNALSAPARILVTRKVTDLLFRTTRVYGARMLARDNGEIVSDALTIVALSGQPLKLHTADGDENIILADAADRILWSRSAQETVSTMIYEAAEDGGRPRFFTETAAGTSLRIRERYAYAPAIGEGAKSWRALNLAGSRTEQRDNAGISSTRSINLVGQPLVNEQRLLTADVIEPDWAMLTESDTEDPLVITGTYDATGAPLAITNAARVTTVNVYDICGALRKTLLQYLASDGMKETVTLRDIHYRSDGGVLLKTAGNGIADTYGYDPYTQRLSCRRTERTVSHPSGALLISELHYKYDPAGNILKIEDKATPTSWHDNRQATGLHEYRYDTLYRLVTATGRERYAVNPNDSTAGQAWGPYREDYAYDDGDNLTVIMHSGGCGDRRIVRIVSCGSNRAVDADSEQTPEEGFFKGGLMRQLPGRRMLSWYADGQLKGVSPVTREGEGNPDDTENYRYADGGNRVRKIRIAMTSGGTQITTTTYAGGVERRRRRLAEMLQLDVVITEGGGVRLIRDARTGVTYLRYAFSDHLGSTGYETDSDGLITSREEYLPFGGGAGADEEAEESCDRTQRYSGKERDATGLIYYGWRYYQPGTGCWLSADPGGLVDGINLFRFCRNNPINFYDLDGQNAEIAGYAVAAIALLLVGALALKVLSVHQRKFEHLERMNHMQYLEEQLAKWSTQQSEIHGKTAEEKRKIRNFIHETYNRHFRGTGTRPAFSTYMDENDNVYAYMAADERTKEVSKYIMSKNPGKLLHKHRVPFVKIGTRKERESNLSSESYFDSMELQQAVRLKVKKVSRQKDVEPTEELPSSSGVSFSERVYEIINKDYFIGNHSDLMKKDKDILLRAIDKLSGGKGHLHKLNRNDENNQPLWSADLPGFAGQTGRGAYRLLYTQKGSQIMLSRIVDPHR